MLDKLVLKDKTIVSQIWRLRVVGCPPPGEMLYRLGIDQCDLLYSVARTMKLLRDLSIDKLTVLANMGTGDAYCEVSILVNHGWGWRQLEFVVPHSGVLVFGNKKYMPEPKPSSWKLTLQRHDGNRSSLQIFRSVRSNQVGGRLLSNTPGSKDTPGSSIPVCELPLHKIRLLDRRRMPIFFRLAK